MVFIECLLEMEICFDVFYLMEFVKLFLIWKWKNVFIIIDKVLVLDIDIF